ILAEALQDLKEAAARAALPPDADNLWAPARARAGRAAAGARRWIAELAPVVGDPETVLDEHGRLPRDRRDLFLAEFTAMIDADAAGLAGTLPALHASLRAT